MISEKVKYTIICAICLVAPVTIYKTYTGEWTGSSLMAAKNRILSLIPFLDKDPYYNYTPSEKDLLHWTKFDLSNMRRYEQAISSAAYNNELDPDLIRAVILVESKFNPKAVSHRGAVGLMQLMPSTARDLKVSNIHNPSSNIAGGSKYLRLMLNRFDNNLILALAAYNAGPSAVDRHKGIPPYPETESYVGKVLMAYNIIQRRSNSTN